MAASPEIVPDDLTNRTSTEIRALAERLHLVEHVSRPNRFLDPVTGRERLRIDPGHRDAVTGQPYRNPRAAVAHAHAYPPSGPRAGKVVDLATGDPHFILRRERDDGLSDAGD